MAWIHMPQPQQCGTQLPSGGAQDKGLEEAVSGREGMGHRYADLDASPTGEPQAVGIDYPATDPPERQGDITPSVADEGEQAWDDVVQPENHARQVDGPSAGNSSASAAEAGPVDPPLPEGK